MLSLRAFVPLAAATGLMAALPAGALAAPAHQPGAPAAGGDVAGLVYPSIVNTRPARAQAGPPYVVTPRRVRAQAPRDRAAKDADQTAPDKALIAMTAARNNLSKAWTG